MNFDPTPEQVQLLDAVAALARRYGHAYFVAKAWSRGPRSASKRWISFGGTAGGVCERSNASARESILEA